MHGATTTIIIAQRFNDASIKFILEPYVKGVFGSTLGNSTKVQSEVEKSIASVCFLVKEIHAVYGPRRSGRDSNQWPPSCILESQLWLYNSYIKLMYGNYNMSILKVKSTVCISSFDDVIITHI